MDLNEWRNNVLREKGWASNPDNQKITRWFLLISTKIRPSDARERELYEQRLDELMDEFSRALPELIKFRFKKHEWTPEYIDDCNVKYSVEVGRGRLRKDGTRGDSGGELHVHVLITIRHHSNITLDHETVREFLEPLCEQYFYTKPFIGRLRLIGQDRTEEYMQKTFRRPEWRRVIEL